MDTKLITFFPGEEVEILRWILQKKIDLLEDMDTDQDILSIVKEMLSRIP